MPNTRIFSVPTSLKVTNSAGYWSFLHHNSIYPRFSAALCALLLCVLTARADASELPNAPEVHQHVFSAVDWSLAAGSAAGRLGDLYSTRQMLARGYHEEILPSSLAHSHAGLTVFEGAAAGLQVFSQYELTRHGHRKMARTMAAVNIGVSFAVDQHNFALPAVARR